MTYKHQYERLCGKCLTYHSTEDISLDEKSVTGYICDSCKRVEFEENFTTVLNTTLKEHFDFVPLDTTQKIAKELLKFIEQQK